jgi:hypothetical protein
LARRGEKGVIPGRVDSEGRGATGILVTLILLLGFFFASVSLDIITCPACHGSGKEGDRSCSYCGGDGKMTLLQFTAYLCGRLLSLWRQSSQMENVLENVSYPIVPQP